MSTFSLTSNIHCITLRSFGKLLLIIRLMLSDQSGKYSRLFSFNCVFGSQINCLEELYFFTYQKFETVLSKVKLYFKPLQPSIIDWLKAQTLCVDVEVRLIHQIRMTLAEHKRRQLFTQHRGSISCSLPRSKDDKRIDHLFKIMSWLV